MPVQFKQHEGRHGLARETFHGRRGEVRQWYREGQEDQLDALGLVVNVIVLWNTLYMEAAVADNDLALGRIVDALSHSRFWKQALILVIEDDSQLEVDHVDGHRTAAFCISPYTSRPNKIPLDEMNPNTKALQGEARRLAEALGRLDLSDVDRADPATISRAIWHSRKPDMPFPWASFHPNPDGDDDDD